jgi:hypothetical protein
MEQVSGEKAKEQESVFECDSLEFRKRVVLRINALIKKATEQADTIERLEERIMELEGGGIVRIQD